MMAALRPREIAFFAGQGRLEKLAQGIQCVMPGVTLSILDERMERGYRGGVAVVRAIFNGSGQRRAVGEVPLREERANFDFRMNSRFHAPVDFQYEPVSVRDGCVGLFRLQNSGPEIGVALAPRGA